MPVPYQIIPQGSVFRPKVETHINDNTFVDDAYLTGGGDITSALCVFASPKGRDREVITIREGNAEFMNEFGLGPFKLYGQPLLNAYAATLAATTTQAMVHCIRVTPADASYSTATLIAQYKVIDGVMHVRFVVCPSQSEIKDLNTELENAYMIDDPETTDGYTKLKLWTIAYRGRGDYGRNIRFRITSDNGSDKNNDFKNYNFSIYRKENLLEQVENFSVTMLEDAIYAGASLAAGDVINDKTSGSDYVRVAMFYDAFEKLFEVYLENNPATEYTLNDFDPLLGLNKYTREKIENLVIDPASEYLTPADDETPVDLQVTSGISLMGGSDGSLGETTYIGAYQNKTALDTAVADHEINPAPRDTVKITNPDAGDTDDDPTDPHTIVAGDYLVWDGSKWIYYPGRETILNQLYLDAFSGKMDPNIKSKNRFPTTFIYDANFDKATKAQIVALTLQRTDCVAILDFGTQITTKGSVESMYYDLNFDNIDTRVVSLEPYCMKVRDPYTKKTVTVTSTYWMISNYFTHIYGWNGKHRPMAGNRFGIIDGYIPDSIYPVFDEDLEADMMDDLADLKCNIAKYNQNQVVVRSMQNTAQSRLSALTELNNVLVLLDVKRACERLVANYEYDFSEPEDIARFNVDVGTITARFAVAQVRRISAHFDKNSWEAARSILHLYVEMVCKDLVKTVIIEIDVNRDDS